MLKNLTLFPYISYLNLSHNDLKHFTADIFLLVPNLETLDISYNNLEGDFPKDVISK